MAQLMEPLLKVGKAGLPGRQRATAGSRRCPRPVASGALQAEPARPMAADVAIKARRLGDQFEAPVDLARRLGTTEQQQSTFAQ